MATSKQTYECYVCQKRGFSNVRVYLDGRDANGKTIYKNEDMSPHQHKGTPSTAERGSPGTVTMSTLNDKLDKIISLLNEKREMV
jgi:hypothetical protein